MPPHALQTKPLVFSILESLSMCSSKGNIHLLLVVGHRPTCPSLICPRLLSQFVSNQTPISFHRYHLLRGFLKVFAKHLLMNPASHHLRVWITLVSQEVSVAKLTPALHPLEGVFFSHLHRKPLEESPHILLRRIAF